MDLHEFALFRMASRFSLTRTPARVQPTTSEVEEKLLHLIKTLALAYKFNAYNPTCKFSIVSIFLFNALPWDSYHALVSALTVSFSCPRYF